MFNDRLRDLSAVYPRGLLNAEPIQRRETRWVNRWRHRTTHDCSDRQRRRLPDGDRVRRRNGDDDLQCDARNRRDHQSLPPGGGCGRFCCCFRAWTFRSSRSALFSSCSACWLPKPPLGLSDCG